GHGQAELDGGGDGLVGGGRQRLAGDRDAVGLGEGPALGGGERGAVLGAGPVQDRADRVPIVAGCAGGGGGVLGGGHRSDHSVRCEVGELVVGQAQLAAVDLGVVLAQQGGAAHVGGGFGEPDRQADGGVGAALRVLDVGHDAVGAQRLVLDDLLGGQDRPAGDVAL